MSKIVKSFFLLLFLGLVVVVTAAVYGYSQLQPVNTSANTQTNFTINRGQSVTAISNELQKAGLIRHPLAFRYVVWQENLDNKLQAGSYMLSASMSANEIAKALTQGKEDILITILEGWRVEEIADMLEEKELPDFDKEEFLELAKNDEGYLFPDSYFIPRSADAQMIYDLLTNTFERKVIKGLEREIRASGKDLKDAIIMASLIEREERIPEEMKTVSGILWNRIDSGMGLNVDATLQYIKGYDKVQKDWWPEPLAADKENPSPYNTYKHSGLPPGPIANPGLDAIKAALTPEKTDYFYYIHDRNGEVHYAKTLDQHNANVQKYLR